MDCRQAWTVRACLGRRAADWEQTVKGGEATCEALDWMRAICYPVTFCIKARAPSRNPNASILEPLLRARMHQFANPNASKLVRVISGRSPLPANGLSQPVALAGEDHNVGMVDQPVHQRRCKTVVTKDSVLLGKLKVGCNNQALAFVAVGDHLKQQLGGILVQLPE